MTRLVLACLLFALCAPMAAALGEQVDLVAVHAPDLVVAEKPFDVSVELHNKGDARRVYLFAALYEGESPSDPCGAQTDARFRGYTPTYQAVVQLAGGARVTWPAEGERWLHVVEREDTTDRPRADEFCVFVAEDDKPPQLEWLDFETLPITTRGVNAKPQATFTWSPDAPVAAQDVTFVASGTDEDGDALSYSWDFGHANASGRARATGAVAYHPFYPDGRFVVTLTVSDGFDDTVVTREVGVAPAVASPTGGTTVVVEQRDETPLPFILAPLAAMLAAALRRLRAPRDRFPPGRSRRQ